MRIRIHTTALSLGYSEHTVYDSRRYEAEQVDVGELAELGELTSPAPLLQLIDKQSVMRSSQADLSQTDRRGLLWLLDEESIFPGFYLSYLFLHCQKVLIYYVF